MNKTVTINLSGIVFHIDENAYDTLKKYIESIRSKFTVADGRDEIVADIEARIAEMFQQRISDSKQAILPDDVNTVINTLGKPEDISNAAETLADDTVAGDKAYPVKKRFFRSPDEKLLGGVCGGISAYFDVDPIWLRLAFALSIFFAGGGLLLYIILWIIIPIAKTPSEKLQMRGEDVTLSAIQKSVKEELEGVKNKAGDMISEVRHRNLAQRGVDFISDVVFALLKFVGKFFSIVAIIISLLILFVITVVLFSVVGIFGFAINNNTFMMMAPRADMILGLVAILLVVGIPAALLFLAGLKWLFKIKWNMKPAATILAGFMLIGVGIGFISAYNISRQYANSAQMYSTVAWQVPQKKALHIKLNNDKTESADFTFGFGTTTIKQGVGYNTPFSNVDLKIIPGSSDSVELVEISDSKGLNKEEAAALVRKIKYDFTYNDTVLSLNSYCDLGQGEAWRGQKVKLILHVPENTSVYFDRSLDDNDFKVDAETTYGDDIYGHTFTMTADGLKCDDCNDKQDDGAAERHEWNHHHNSTDSLKMQFKHSSTKNLPISFVDYLKSTVTPDKSIDYQIGDGASTTNENETENTGIAFH